MKTPPDAVASLADQLAPLLRRRLDRTLAHLSGELLGLSEEQARQTASEVRKSDEAGPITAPPDKMPGPRLHPAFSRSVLIAWLRDLHGTEDVTAGEALAAVKAGGGALVTAVAEELAHRGLLVPAPVRLAVLRRALEPGPNGRRPLPWSAVVTPEATLLHLLLLWPGVESPPWETNWNQAVPRFAGAELATVLQQEKTRQPEGWGAALLEHGWGSMPAWPELLYMAESEVERDRRRPAVAIDAHREHHFLLTGWASSGAGLRRKGSVDESRRSKPHRPRWGRDTDSEDARVEVFIPGHPVQLSLKLEDNSPSDEIVRVIKRLAKWEGVRNWAALQRLLSIEGKRNGWVRWTLDAHFEALGYSPAEMRRTTTRTRVADIVKLFTKIELRAIVGGSERECRPLMLIGSRFEKLQGSIWALDGIELQVNPLLYRGVRNKETGRLGRYWYPTVPEVAQLDHRHFGPALMLGLVLPIRWQWNRGKYCLAISGANLLKLAGINFDPHRPKDAWAALARNLSKLQEIDALGEWTTDGPPAQETVYRLTPPSWARDRVENGVVPVEYHMVELPQTGAELRSWREARGWTKVQLAKALGVSGSTAFRAEGRGRLTAAILKGLQRAK